ncbi:MAG: biotin/lipoyl-containing protein [Luteitalea sp.]
MRLHIEQSGASRQVTIDSGATAGTVVLQVEGRAVVCDVRDLGHGHLSLRFDDGSMHDVIVETGTTAGARLVHTGGVTLSLTVRARAARPRGPVGAANGPVQICAPMPGKIVRLPVRPGDAVEARQPVVVIEAMKMENALVAVRAGIVRDVLVQEGMSVEAGRPLVVLE